MKENKCLLEQAKKEMEAAQEQAEAAARERDSSRADVALLRYAAVTFFFRSKNF